MTRTAMSGLRTVPKPAEKPASNVYTVLLLMAFLFLAGATILTVMDLVQTYKVDVAKAFWPF